MVKPKKQSLEDYTADLLIKHEGFRDTVYLDGNGIPTIGYGFTDPAWIKKGRITKAEARQELKRQIKSRQNTLRSKLGPEIWDNLQDSSKAALTSYHYNYPAGFKDTTRLMKNWRAGRYYDAIREIDAGMNDENNRGLRTRRLEEQGLLMEDPFFSKPSDSELVRQLKQNQWKPQSVLKPVVQQKQDYPIQIEAPQTLNAYNMPESPSYTTRLSDIQQFMNAVMSDQYQPQYTPIQTTNQIQPVQNVILPDGNKTMKFTGLKNGKLPKCENGYAPVYNIPEVTITPDKQLRARVNETWPNKDVRQQVFYEVNKYKKLAERYPNVYYVGHNLTSSDIGPDTYDAKELPANYEIERLMNIVNASGNPRTVLYNDRSSGNSSRSTTTGDDGFRYADKLTDRYRKQNSVITVNTSDIRDPYMSELAHAFQFKTGLVNESETKPELLLNMGVDSRDKEGYSKVDAYRNANNLEYAAHNIIQPMIYEYLRNNKSIRQLKSNIRSLIDVARRYPQQAHDKAVKYGTYQGSNWYIKPAYKDGKSPIRIKPANRGKLTVLKKRTGKSESELYNDGNPAHKKMVVFARNARKWKH